MNTITLKQLRYFEAVAQQRHFGRAADICAISQPAISVQIKELEQTLGAALFERGPREARLTAFGEAFAERARAALRSVDDLTNLARAAQDALAGKLRLGVIPTIAPYLLPAVFRDFATAYPELDLHVRETLTDKLLQELAEGRLDLAMVALPVSEPSLSEVFLFEESFILVRARADADQPVPSPDRLETMRLLLLEEGHCFRDQALAFCKAPSLQAGRGLDGSSLSTLVQMVGAGLGVTLIPEMAVAIEQRSADISLARFPGNQPARRIGLVWRKTNPMAEQYMKMAETVKQTAANFFEAHPFDG